MSGLQPRVPEKRPPEPRPGARGKERSSRRVADSHKAKALRHREVNIQAIRQHIKLPGYLAFRSCRAGCRGTEVPSATRACWSRRSRVTEPGRAVQAAHGALSVVFNAALPAMIVNIAVNAISGGGAPGCFQDC